MSTLFEEELKSFKTRKVSNKSNIVYKKFNKSSDASNKNTQNVVVKITGGAKDSKAASRHLDYISRNNTLDVYDQENQKIDYDLLQRISDRLVETDESRANSKKSYQMVFSMNGVNDKEKLRAAILQTAQKEFEGYDFYFAIHSDTKNTHGHLVVYRNPLNTNKRLEIRKSKLNSIKKTYSAYLNKLGIQSHFQSHSDKFKNTENSTIHKFKRPRVNSNHYKVIDYGVAPYQFNVGSQESFYVLLENKNGTKKQHWSWGIKEEIANKGIKRGDTITLKKINNAMEDERTKSVWTINKIAAEPIEHKAYSIVDYGKANYRFHENTKESFYLLLRNELNEVKQVWNKKIESFLKDNALKKGDKITLSSRNIFTPGSLSQQQNISKNRTFTSLLDEVRNNKDLTQQQTVSKGIKL